MFFDKATKYEAESNYKEAVTYYERAFKVSDNANLKLEASKKLSFIYEVIQKNYKLAKTYLKYSIVNIGDFKKAKEFEQRLAEINFNYLQDYQEALISLHKLIDVEESPIKKNELQMKIAQAYLRSNDPGQALIEIDKILSNTSVENNFDPLFLKANILQSQNKNSEVIPIFIDLESRFPDKSKENEIFIALSLCYEQDQQLDKAIAVLEKNKSNYKTPEFVEMRIASLKKRLKLAPLVRELKK